MKNTSKILALVLVVMTVLMSLSAITASAADGARIVNVGDLAEGVTGDGELVAGTGIYAFAGMTIEGNNKTVEDVKYTKRLKLPGAMKVDANYIKFDVAGPVKVTVIAISGKSAEARPLKIAKLVEGALQDVAGASYDVPGDVAAKYEYTLSEAGTYYLGSGKSGINLYYIAIEDACKHTGGTATCKDKAVCELCEQPYGELSTDHNFVDGTCSVCGVADPDGCKHEEKVPATCTEPEKCASCEAETAPALGHKMVAFDAVAANCTEAGNEAGEKCSVCDYTTGGAVVAALGHDLTFTNVPATATAPGSIKAHCSRCEADLDLGTYKAMGPGKYVLDAEQHLKDVTGGCYDGQVMVINEVFACHLSAKYKTDKSSKDFSADLSHYDYRMNFGAISEAIVKGEGEEATPTGGLKNFIQITVTDASKVTLWWVCGGDNADNGATGDQIVGRQMAIYDMEGNLVALTSDTTNKGSVHYSTLNIPTAGTYLIGAYIPEATPAVKAGGNYLFHLEVEVKDSHTHEFVNGECACGEKDPTYVPEEKPEDKPTDGGEPAPEPSFLDMILAWIMSFIEMILGWFKF